MNPYTISCETCQRKLRVKDMSAVGRILSCPSCGSMVLVPPPAEQEAAAPYSATSQVATDTPEAPQAPANNEDIFAEAAAWLGDEPPREVAPPDSNMPAAPPRVSPTIRRPAPNEPIHRPELEAWRRYGLVALAALAGVTTLSLGIWWAVRPGPSAAAAAATKMAAANSEDDITAGLNSPEAPEHSAAESDARDNLETSSAKGEPADAALPRADAAAPTPAAVAPSASNPPGEEDATPVGLAPPFGGDAISPFDTAVGGDVAAREKAAGDDVEQGPFNWVAAAHHAWPMTLVGESAIPVEPVAAPPASAAPPHNVAGALNMPIPSLEIESIPLIGFVRFVSSLAGTPITLRAEDIASVGATPQSRLAISIDDATVGDILKMGLAKHRLAYRQTPGGLEVVAADEANHTPLTVAHFIDDLVARDQDANVDQAQRRILRLAEIALTPGEGPPLPGGPGENRRLTVMDGSLVLVATRREQWRVHEFLERLRVARGGAPRSKRPERWYALDPREERAFESLSETVRVHFATEEPLLAIVARMCEDAKSAAVIVDWDALHAAGLTPSSLKTTFRCGGLPLREAAEELARPLGLTTRVADWGVVEITTHGAKTSEPIIEFYDTTGLTTDRLTGERLAEHVSRNLAPRDDLAPLDAPANSAREIRAMFDPASGYLIVHASETLHDRLARRIKRWRG